MTLPNVCRSADQPSRRPSSPHQPEYPTRKPVRTSSWMSSAPCVSVMRRSAALKPGSGGTTPMLAGAASVMTAAMRSPCSANAASTASTSLYGTTTVSRGDRGGDAGGVGQAEGRDAGAGRGQQRVDVPVVAAGELHDQVAAGERARQAQRRHRRLGAGGDQADLLGRGDARADLVDEVGLGEGRGAEAQAAAGGVADRVDDLGVRVAEQRRTPASRRGRRTRCRRRR